MTVHVRYPDGCTVSASASWTCGIVDALVQAGLASSASDARRKLAAGAVSVDGVRVTADDALEPGGHAVRMGRRYVHVNVPSVPLTDAQVVDVLAALDAT